MTPDLLKVADFIVDKLILPTLKNFIKTFIKYDNMNICNLLELLFLNILYKEGLRSIKEVNL